MALNDYFGRSLAQSAATTTTVKSTQLFDALWGGVGADKILGSGSGQVMSGLGGDDTYYVKSALDRVVEAAGGGIDTVIASNVRSYKLGDQVENLTLSGKAWGFGNDAANIIQGQGNSQTLDGGKGDDVLSGGADADTFVFGRGSGHDLITDFRVSEGDQIRIDGYGLANFAQVHAAMTQVGADVVLKLSDSDGVRIANTNLADLTASAFQLGIDTSKLTMTFSEEFNSLSLADNLTGQGGVWTTAFDFGSPVGAKSLASHTLLNNDEQQIYVDPTYAGSGAKGSVGLGINPFAVQDGVLSITAAKTPEALKSQLFNMEYTSGLLTTEHSFYQQYGYFEMKAALPTGQGVWPAFWLLPQDGTNPLELDVMEAVGGDMAYQTSHFSEAGVKSKESFSNFVSDPGSFHTYGMLWTAKELAWYIDGVEVSSMATPADLNRPMFMLANLAVGGNWAGDATFDSATMKVDYIRAYSVDANATAGNINPNGVAAPAALEIVVPAKVIAPPEADRVIKGTGLAETLMGGTGNDLLKGGGGDDILNGGDGNDTATYADSKVGVVVNLTLTGAQTVSAGHADTLVSVENLVGSHFDDVLTGDAGANTLDGGAGKDILIGGAGHDELIGGAGDDVLVGGAGDDQIDGGAGNDTASYAGSMAGVKVSLATDGEQATGGGGKDTLISIENLQGSSFDDVLTGDDGKNILIGGDGADTLDGGRGKDVLMGGAGADKLTGGAGADTFLFTSVSDSTLSKADTILDFRAKEGDIIDLSGIDASTSAVGDQSFYFMGTGAFTRHAGELRYTADAAGAHVYGDTNGDGVADFHIIVAGLSGLQATDFVL